MNKRAWLIPIIIVAINALAIAIRWASLPLCPHNCTPKENPPTRPDHPRIRCRHCPVPIDHGVAHIWKNTSLHAG